ncbi:TRAP transporter small permease subunit [Candidatus Gracilibacteria bacterium]|nr:TRAP transporter small permease subunit [Candidatus Gracilibacteria bacterium]
MQALLRVSKGIDALNEFIGRIAYWLVPLVVAVGVWNTMTRYIGRATGQILGSNFYIEAQWYLFTLIAFLGGAYNLLHNEHVRVDVLYGSWSPRQKAWANLIGALLILIPFCVLIIYFSWPAITNSWQIRESSPDPGGLPRYPIKTIIPIAFGLLIAQGISEIIKNAAFLSGQGSFMEEHNESKAL